MNFFYVVLVCILASAKSCYIWGTDSGSCDDRGLDALFKAEEMSFCQAAVNYPVCFPAPQNMPPTKAHPNGRWDNNTVWKKDKWVEEKFTEHVQRQIGFEKNKTMYKRGVDINGHKGHVRRRFWKRPDCQNAFKNLFCWLNFPRCDLQRDLTLPTCRSACENFFKACFYHKDLWRCGKSKFFNGYEPEVPTVAGGNITYLREYFPGQPWRQNKYTHGGSEIAVCTPAILGAGHSLAPSWTVSLLLPMLMSLILVLITCN